ncbi:MAG: hypothetical protein V3S81_05615 [Anaerolineales bacterium]
MKKLRSQLEQLGGSKELVEGILESLKSHKTQIEEQAKADFQERLDQAKKVCTEELNGYKKELARKVQLFFESRSTRIDQQIAKQTVVKEAAAETKLKDVVNVLAGIEANGEGDKAEFDTLKEQVGKLQTENTKLTGQNSVLAEKANRAHGLASQTLQKNKALSSELAEAKATTDPISEGKDKGKGKGKTKPKAKAKTGKPLSEGKKQAPTVTRAQDQSQIRKPKAKKASKPQGDGFSVAAIADGMEE